MSLKAWAGLLGEFGRQSEAYAKRQQELEGKRMEEERENRRMAALLAKEQALETWRANRPLSANEQEDREQKKKLVDAQIDSYKALAGQRESKTVSEADVDALAAQLSEQNNGDMVMARAQARAMLSGGGGKAGAGGVSGATGTAGALKLGNADLFKDETIETGDTTQTVRRYLNGAKVPNYSEDEFVQMATERANAWREQKGKGWLNAEPSEEDTSAFIAEQVKALKEANAAQHRAAFEESKRVFSEFNAQPGGLIAPQGKAGQQEAPGEQPSLTDKIGKPNANATIDFEALFKARDDIESNGKDFRADGKPVKSSAGAMYKNQVMPATAADPGLGVKPAKITKGMTEEEKAAEYNRVGDDYLKALVDRYDGNIATAYAAYNAGFGRIDRWIEKGADPADLPKETRDYVANTMAKYESYVSKKSDVLDGEQPATAGAKPQDDLVARVKARADQARAAAGAQKPANKERIEVDTDPFGGAAMLAEAGGATDSTKGQSLGTAAGKAARGAVEGAKATGRGLLYLRDQGEKVGQLSWWKEQLNSLSETVRANVAAAQERAGYNDATLQAMYEEQAKKGKSVEEFIRDFISAYGGDAANETAGNKQKRRDPSAVLGMRG